MDISVLRSFLAMHIFFYRFASLYSPLKATTVRMADRTSSATLPAVA